MASADGLAVALLAAGRSTRFGTADKLGALLGGRPLLAWAAQAGCAIEAEWRFVVAGPDMRTDVPGYERLINAQPEQGLASSLRMAAGAAAEVGAGALLILLADMPFLEAEHLRRLVDVHREEPACAVFSVLPEGVPQPPALFPAELFGALRALEGDKGARGLAAGARLVEAGESSLFDVDTAEDLERARLLLGQ